MKKWIQQWTKFVQFEDSFDPTMLLKYKRGDIITVALGYNVGSEQGGNRPCVVLDNNKKSNPVVYIMPLGTVKSESNVHPNNIFLGKLEEYNKMVGNSEETLSVAIPSQIRSISKLRIVFPKKNTHTVVNIGEEKMSIIQNKINNIFN